MTPAARLRAVLAACLIALSCAKTPDHGKVCDFRWFDSYTVDQGYWLNIGGKMPVSPFPDYGGGGVPVWVPNLVTYPARYEVCVENEDGFHWVSVVKSYWDSAKKGDQWTNQ